MEISDLRHSPLPIPFGSQHLYPDRHQYMYLMTCSDRQTDGQTSRQLDIKTDQQTERIDRQTNRQANRPLLPKT